MLSMHNKMIISIALIWKVPEFFLLSGQKNAFLICPCYLNEKKKQT